MRERPCDNRSHEKQREKRETPPLALKVKEGAMSQGTEAASGSWQREGKRFSPGASRRNQFCGHYDFSPIRFILDIWPPDL